MDTGATNVSNGDDEAIENLDSSSERTQENCPGAPLDLSFKCLVNFQEVAEEAKLHEQVNLNRSPTTEKLFCNAVRVNNNSISDWKGMEAAFSDMLVNPDDLAWLDISFNELHNIDEVITKYKNIRVLYLHGNSIEKISDVRKLAAFPHLRNLTLHGNPIEAEAGYRQLVLSMLPTLRNLDFSGVTKQDRSTAETWSAMNRKASKKRKHSSS